MYPTLIGLLFFPLVVYTLNLTSNDSFEFDCAALPYRLNLTTNTRILFSTYVTSNTNISLADADSTCVQQYRGARSQLVPVDICRVGAYTETSKRSGIHFELWLPRSWSGRFISHGNGGLSGCMYYLELGSGSC
jgi:feruloyl esterase